MDIRNVFCIGRNYAEHAAELGNHVPDKPLVFSKPTNSLVMADGNSIDYPSDQGEIHHELEIVLYIGKDIENDNFQVDEVVTSMALGIDLTLRDVQTELKESGHPWLLAKGFINAAVVTEFWDFPGLEACEAIDFSLTRNGVVVQNGNTKDMIFPFQSLLTYVHEHFSLRKGDIIFTGTPEGVGPISHRDTYELWWGDFLKGSFNVCM